MHIRRQKRLFRALFFIWLVCFLTLLYIPQVPQVNVRFLSGFIRVDYLSHFIFNLILTYLFLLWISDTHYNVQLHKGLLPFMGGIIFCTVTEFTQHRVVPFRAFEIQDLISNISGMTTGLLSFALKSPYKLIYRLLVAKPHNRT